MTTELNYKFFEEWFDKRRYKSRNHRTLYSNHRSIHLIDDQFQSKLLETIADRHNRWSSFNTTTEPYTLIFNNDVITIPSNVNPTQYVYRNPFFMGMEWEKKQELARIVGDECKMLSDKAKSNPEEFLKFYPKDSFALVQFARHVKEPTIVYHPNNTRTFSSYGWGPRAMSSINTISIYGKRFAGYTATNSHPDVNGVIVFATNNRAYMVTADNPYTTVKAKRCSYCMNTGLLVEMCNIGHLNMGSFKEYSIAMMEEHLKNSDYHKNLKISHYKIVDKQIVYYCQHNQKESHENWTNLSTCWACNGVPKGRVREVLQGFQWSGLPVLIGAHGKVLDKFNEFDLTESRALTKHNRGQWSDWTFGVSQDTTPSS